MSITISDIILETNTLVRENPNNTYDAPSCCYNSGECSNGSIGCIFGQVFRKLGNEIPSELENKSIRFVLDHFHIEYRDKESAWLLSIQNAQDVHETWLAALNIANVKSPLPT